MHSILSMSGLLSRKIIGYSYLEIILIMYGLTVNFTSRFLFESLLEVNNFMQVFKTSIYIAVVASILGASARVLGSQDYRFQQMYHILPLIVTSVNVTIYVGTVSTSYEYKYGEIPMDQLWLLLLVAVAPLVLQIVHTMWVIFSISQPYIDTFNEISKKYADGDLEARIEGSLVLDDYVFGQIGSFQNHILHIAQTNYSRISNISDMMITVAEQIASGSEEINASVEQIASTSASMSHGASSQTELISGVNQNITNLTTITDEIMRTIQNNTQEVSQIALQTNILALNAGIEASRAGDYGRGFAVVAENVRKLSDQSRMAAERIEDVSNEIAGTLQDSLHEISSAMLNIVSVSEETSASAEEVAASTTQMVSNMEEFTGLAEKLALMSTETNS